MMILTARTKGREQETYDTLEKNGLEGCVEQTTGKGTPENPYCSIIRLRNIRQDRWQGILHVELTFPGKNPQFFMPGFMYGRNRGEAPVGRVIEYPRMRAGEMRRPVSPWWMVRSDRLSHPASLVYDDGRIYGLCASPYFIIKDGRKTAWDVKKDGDFYQFAGFSCSLEKNRIGYTLGYENAPWMFVQARNIKERSALKENCFALAPGEEIRFAVYHFAYETENISDIYDALEKIYWKYHVAPVRKGDVLNGIRDISQAVSEDAWCSEDKSYYGFVFEEEGAKRRYNKIYSVSWTNGLTVAVPVLLAALATENEAMRGQALQCIENIAENCINARTNLPYGAYQDGVWSNRGWWFDDLHTEGHSGYLAGQAVYYLLKTFDYEKRFRGIRHENWLALAGKAVGQFEKSKNTDGEYPYIFSETTGAGQEYDSMGSAWCLASTAYYSWLAEDRQYLEEMKESAVHYYRRFISNVMCYGGPLDTDKAVDSESVLPYIRAMRWLHQLTGEEIWLDYLRAALCYEFTFKICYNIPVQVPPLSTTGWSSCGGSITSVANPHVHPMSVTVVEEMLYYLKQRTDAYIESRLRDTVLWSCQTYNHYDGEYDYGRKGWMSERFCHCEGLLVQKYPDGSPASTWFALMPWACGSVLEGLCGIAGEQI